MFGLFRATRKFLIFCVLVLLATASACFVTAGRMLTAPGALSTPAEADVIYVLSGGLVDRWLEAYDLWVEKRAPIILISRGSPDGAGVVLEARGIHVPDGADAAREVLVDRLGLPPAAVELLERRVDNTAAEAEALLDLARARGWRRAIIVTSMAHTRRTHLAMSRVLEPAGISVQVRGSRYDTFDAARWWRSRSSARWVLNEFPKLVAYRLGLGE